MRRLLMKLLRTLADRRNPRSLSSWFRRRRGRHLVALIAGLNRPCRILDVGGEKAFWDRIALPPDVSVTLLNLDLLPQFGRPSLLADARRLPFPERAFDLVVSNSVIEHVGTADDQVAMAAEILRVGRGFYVQTPNRWFPVDPHFLVPLYHLAPRSLRIAILRRTDVGWLSRAASQEEAAQTIDSIRLLDARALRRLFPGARIWRERFGGLTKSLVAFRIE